MNGTSTAVAPFSEVVAHATTPDRSRTWRRVTLTSAACITLLDVALLQRKHAIFTGGFLSGNQLGTFADGLAFLLMSALLNTTIAAPLCICALAVGRRLHLRPLALLFVAFAAAVVPLATADFVAYQVWLYLGDAFDFHLLYNLTGRRISEFFAVSAPLMSRPLILFSVAVCGVAGADVCRTPARPTTEPLRPHTGPCEGPAALPDSGAHVLGRRRHGLDDVRIDGICPALDAFRPALRPRPEHAQRRRSGRPRPVAQSARRRAARCRDSPVRDRHSWKWRRRRRARR